MSNPQRAESRELIENLWEVEDRGQDRKSLLIRPPMSYRQAFGDKPIRVGNVECQILLFLANRPYHAFTRHQIAEAVKSSGLSVSEAAVDDHVAALRDQLGVLHDFVQTVPHVGYRYKA